MWKKIPYDNIDWKELQGLHVSNENVFSRGLVFANTFLKVW